MEIQNHNIAADTPDALLAQIAELESDITDLQMLYETLWSMAHRWKMS